MDTYLSKALAGYYARVGNKLVFRNGDDLNQLSLNMYERLDYQEIDTSVLSRVIHGKRLFSGRQLEIFCSMMNASKSEQSELQSALAKDRLQQYNLETEGVISHDDLVELAMAHLQAIHQVRIQGNPQQAITMTEGFPRRMLEISTKSFSSKHLQPFYRIVGEMLFEKSIAYLETKQPQEMKQYILPLVYEMRRIAKKYRDQELYGLVDSIIGNIYYNLKEYHKSIRPLLRASQNIANVDRQLFTLRELALSYAYLQYQPDFKVVVNEIMKIKAKGNFSDWESILHPLEGIGRGYGLLRSSKAFDIFDEAKQINDVMTTHNQKAPLRTVQLVRSNLEVAQFLEPKQTRVLEQMGKEGLRRAEEYGYPRYVKTILDILNHL